MTGAQAFVALNLVLKPALDAVVNDQLAALAARNGDEYLSLLLAEFQRDSERSRAWTAALVTYALSRDPSVADVVRAWTAKWQPMAEAAVSGLAVLFAGAPQPIEPADVEAAATATRHAEAAAAGL